MWTFKDSVWGIPGLKVILESGKIVRRVLLCFTLLALALPQGALAQTAPRIEVEISQNEVLSLYYFVRAAMGDAHKNPRLREIWSEHATAADKEALQRFGDALIAGSANLSHYTRVERPTKRFVGASLGDVIEAHAGVSSSIDDLAVRITGLLPVAAQADFVAGLQAIAPLHREHVWKPSRSFAKQAERDLKKAAAEHDLELRFGQVARFYGANWPDNVPIRIYLVGVPGPVQRLNAHSAGPIGVVEVVADDDIGRRLAVLFHELCHSLYKAQPVEQQVALEKAWHSHPLSEHAGIAYAQVNEGLATALGNGWFRKTTGRVNHAPESSWYADPVVDGFAKTLYPVILHYLEQGRTMDESFVNYAVARFIMSFPDATRDPRVVFRSVFIGVGSGLDRRGAVRAAQRGLGATSIWSGKPLDDDQTKASYGKRLTTLLVVRPGTAVEELAGYPEKLATSLEPELRRTVPHAKVVDADGLLHLVVVVDDDSQVRPILELVSDSARLDDGDIIRLP